MNQSKEMAKLAYTALSDKKGEDIQIIDDFGDIIVHVFDRENRQFYNLERIWKDGHHVSVEDLEA